MWTTVGSTILSFVFLTILAGYFANWLQHRNWMRQQRITLRDRRVAELKSIFVDLDSILSKRLYRMRRLLWALRRGDHEQIEAKLADYDAILYEWNDRRNAFQIRLVREVSVDMAQDFEHVLSRDFISIGNRLTNLTRSILGGTQPRRFRDQLTELENELSLLSRSVYEFLRSIYIELQTEGRRVFDDNQAGGDIEALSSWELLKTLFVPNNPPPQES